MLDNNKYFQVVMIYLAQGKCRVRTVWSASCKEVLHFAKARIHEIELRGLALDQGP